MSRGSLVGQSTGAVNRRSWVQSPPPLLKQKSMKRDNCDHSSGICLSPDYKYICRLCGKDISKIYWQRKPKRTCQICNRDFVLISSKSKYCPLCRTKYNHHYKIMRARGFKFLYKIKEWARVWALNTLLKYWFVKLSAMTGQSLIILSAWKIMTPGTLKNAKDVGRLN